MQVETPETHPFVRIVHNIPSIGELHYDERQQIERWLMEESRVVVFKGLSNRDDGADELAFAQRFPHSEEWAKGAVGRLGNVVPAAEGDGWEPVEMINKLGREWHCDGAQNLMPTVVTHLSCAFPSASPGGSQTLFVDSFAGYESLSEADRAFADSVAVKYSTKYVTGGGSEADWANGLRTREDGCGVEPGTETAPDVPFSLTASGKQAKLLRNHDTTQGYEWLANPLVRAHPHSQRRALWQSCTEMECLEAIDGSWSLSREESLQRMAELLGPGVADDKVYAHTWERGDYVCWNNVGVAHSTEHYDYDNDKRFMHILSGGKGPPYQPGAWARLGPPTITKHKAGNDSVGNTLHEMTAAAAAADYDNGTVATAEAEAEPAAAADGGSGSGGGQSARL
jgi:alpha-ketoglutarate-dependent taurine dioxygenase